MAYGLVVDLALKLGAPKPLTGLWTCEVDDHWAVALNGDEADAEWEGFTIPRFHCAVTFNGFPAGFFHAFGGQIAAGRAANEAAFCEALRQAFIRARQVTAGETALPSATVPPGRLKARKRGERSSVGERRGEEGQRMSDPLLDILRTVPMRCADCGATMGTDLACPDSPEHTWETDDAAIARAVRRWLREQLAALLDGGTARG